MRKYHIELNTTNQHNGNEFESLRQENEDLKQHIFQLESKLFMKMDCFTLVEKKSKTKCLSPSESQQLFSDINNTYDLTIKILKQSCLSITEEDIIFCCLSKLNLDNTSLSHCMGSSSRPAINQRRYRIKKKMSEAKCEYLLDMIFSSEK